MMPPDFPVFGTTARRAAPSGLGPLEPEVAARACWIPSLVDLQCEPGFPGFPVRENRTGTAASARSGGFLDLLLSPHVDPVVDTPEQLSRAQGVQGDVRLHFAAALTPGLRGQELSEVGLLRRAGAIALSDGGVPMGDSVVLRNALEYASEFEMLVLLRPADAALDALGVAHDSPLATRLGLRGNPAASEEIGVARAVALCRSTRARVHLTHLGTRRGVDALAAAIEEGLPITGSTAARSLLLDETTLDDGRYDTRLRLHPPLRTAEDREALRAAVRAGVLLLAADHQPRAPEEKEHEFERAVPGSAGLRSAFGAAMAAMGDLAAVVSALADGPARLLDLPPRGWALVDPDARWELRPERGVPADALEGHPLRGKVLAVSSPDR
jgi:dihydroorotase